MDQIQEALEGALEARRHAYVPYSNFPVGAAAKVAGKAEIVYGCNVENASFGATVCAERNAIFTAVAKYGRVAFDFLMVLTEANPPAVPCALCLQVMAEFCDPKMPIHLATPEGVQRTLLLEELLPEPFTAFG
ncbi:MAG: cytidine deaminase [Spirochaetaceae bacterium]